MAYSRPFTGTKKPEFIDPKSEELITPSGIYIGIIKKIVEGSRNGTIQVYIDKFGGNDANDDRNWVTVQYASPFMGFTLGNPASGKNKFGDTQHGYGMFMTPPDVGNYVLCCFVENNNGTDGYWFSCVSPNLSRYSIPGNGSLPLSKIDQTSISPDLKKYIKSGGSYPVTEFNEYIGAKSSDWITQVPRPINSDLVLQFITQGLDSDVNRGPISSSSQRDAISGVFGVSTPGRPIPAQDPANIPNISQKIRSGNFSSNDIPLVTSRLAGHSLVMDDGDIYGKNNLTRLRSAGGHQIIMNDTEKFIYISNSTGTAWVELTASGDVLIYGARDFSVRTQGSIQFHSNTAIIMDAPTIQVKGRNSLKLETDDLMTFNSKNTLSAFAKNSFNLTTENRMEVFNKTMGINSKNRLDIFGKPMHLNGDGKQPTGVIPENIEEFKLADTSINDTGWFIKDESLISTCYRVPSHEPFLRSSIAKAIQTREKVKESILSNKSSITTISGQIVKKPPSIVSALSSATATATALSSATATAASNLVGGAGQPGGNLQPPPKPAPDSIFKQQPDPGKNLGKLSKEDVQATFAQIGYTESGGNYIPIDPKSEIPGVNSLGYVGKYQFGSGALQDLGFVKPGTPQTPEALSNPNNWIGGVGKPASLDDFLNNGALQEQAMYNYTKNNYNTLEKLGVITETTSKEEIAGFLGSSHLGGPGGTAKWVKNGLNPSDANGTKLSDYYANARSALANANKISVATAAQKQLGVG